MRIETSDPGFVNEAANDFHLVGGSRMIDAAAALTNTASAGSGHVAGGPGRFVLLRGQRRGRRSRRHHSVHGRPDTAVITSINYSTNTLTLDRALTWSSGEGVTLKYSGPAPDMGAYEYGTSTAAPSRLGPRRICASFRSKRVLKGRRRFRRRPCLNLPSQSVTSIPAPAVPGRKSSPHRTLGRYFQPLRTSAFHKPLSIKGLV
jgi:hypothetical protein